MRLDQLSKSELLRHVLCQPELTDLEQALANVIEEEPDIDVVEELEQEATQLQSSCDDLEVRNDDLNSALVAIEEILDEEKTQQTMTEEIEEIIKKAL